MFSKIKKSKVYKGLLIATTVITVIAFVAWMFCAFCMFIIVCFGMWADHRYEVVSIDNVFSSQQVEYINITSTTINLVGYNEDETGIDVEMTYTADVRNELKVSNGHSWGDYTINKAYIDGKELNADDEEFVINSLGIHELTFAINYKAQIDIYEDYKAIQIKNNIDNSSLNLSDKFKVEQQDDLLNKKAIIKVYDAESSFNFTPRAERNIYGKLYSICPIVGVVGVGIIVLLTVPVLIGAAVEKKRAVESAPQEKGNNDL